MSHNVWHHVIGSMHKLCLSKCSHKCFPHLLVGDLMSFRNKSYNLMPCEQYIHYFLLLFIQIYLDSCISSDFIYMQKYVDFHKNKLHDLQSQRSSLWIISCDKWDCFIFDQVRIAVHEAVTRYTLGYTLPKRYHKGIPQGNPSVYSRVNRATSPI